MARNKEKIERNRIREKYAREYAGKIRKKDADIAALLRKNQELSEKIARLEEKSALDGVTIQRLDELVAFLQKCSEMSERDLDNLKASLESRRKAMDAAKRLDGTMSAMSKALGGSLAGCGIQSMVYDILGGGKGLAGLFGGFSGKGGE